MNKHHLQNNHCKCGRSISDGHKRCKSCENKRRFKMGIFKKSQFKNKCKCGNKKYKYATQCWNCFNKTNKGITASAYKQGKTLIAKICKCGKKIMHRSTHCASCWAKIRFKNPKNHPCWRGGKQKIRRPRKTKKYQIWRIKVFKRDNYICQKCHQIGGKLEAHHIKSWVNFPKLRFRVSNGLTLCYKCHKRGKVKKGE